MKNRNLITYKGNTKTLGEWAKELGISYATLYQRLNVLGYSVEEALNKKGNKKSNRKKVMIASDLHVPFQHPDFLKELEKHKDIDHLIIGGDLLDCASISSFPMLMRPKLEEELVQGHEFINKALSIMKDTATIECTKGNHEERIEKGVCKMQDKGFQNMLDPQVLRMLEEGFSYYEDKVKYTYPPIERFHYHNIWCKKFFDNMFVGHPKNFSVVPARVSENFAKHVLNNNSFEVEEGDLFLHGHTHKFSFLVNDRLQNFRTIELGCNCKDMDYANQGILNYTSQTRAYVIIEFEEGEKIQSNDIRFYFY